MKGIVSNKIHSPAPGRDSLAEHELIFPADCPALGYTLLYVDRGDTADTVSGEVVRGAGAGRGGVAPSVTADMQYYTGGRGSEQRRVCSERHRTRHASEPSHNITKLS